MGARQKGHGSGANVNKGGGSCSKVLSMHHFTKANAASLPKYLCYAIFCVTAWFLCSKISDDGALDVALYEYYKQRPEEFKRRLEAAAQDPVLRPVLAAIQANGPQEVLQHLHNEELLIRFGEKMGGVPDEIWAEKGVGVSLHEAARSGIVGVVRGSLQQLEDVGGSIERKDEERGMTALAYAAAYGHKSVVSELLAAGADVQAVDKGGNTILHFAAGYGRSEICALLQPHTTPADLHTRQNAQGQTPADVAKINGHDLAALFGGHLLRTGGSSEARKKVRTSEEI